MEIKKLKERYKLTTNEDETLIYLKPLDEHSFVTYPLDNLEKPILQVTLNEYLGLMLRIYKFSEDLLSIVENPVETEENIAEE